MRILLHSLAALSYHLLASERSDRSARSIDAKPFVMPNAQFDQLDFKILRVLITLVNSSGDIAKFVASLAGAAEIVFGAIQIYQSSSSVCDAEAVLMCIYNIQSASRGETATPSRQHPHRALAASETVSKIISGSTAGNDDDNKCSSGRFYNDYKTRSKTSANRLRSRVRTKLQQEHDWESSHIVDSTLSNEAFLPSKLSSRKHRAILPPLSEEPARPLSVAWGHNRAGSAAARFGPGRMEIQSKQVNKSVTVFKAGCAASRYSWTPLSTQKVM